MKYIITNKRGQRLALVDTRDEARATGRHHAKQGTPVMIYLANDDGVMLSYSSNDTAAANKR